MKNRHSENVDLYRLIEKGSTRPVYLPKGSGLTLEEAERLKAALATETYIKQVYWAEEDEQ